MKTLRLWGAIICMSLFVFSSCSPVVTTSVLKSYSPLTEYTPVNLYEFGEQAPDSAEVIGVVMVRDNGFSTKCNYPTVINLAKQEARKIGGDGLQITDHLEPSFWGSSCHQVRGAILRLQENDSLHSKKEADYFSMADYNRIKSVHTKNDRKTVLPYEVSINIGYGLIINRTKGISGVEKDYENKISNGVSWDVKFNRYYKSSLGWGLIYSGYTSSAVSPFNGNDHTILLTYIAPAFIGKTYISQKWLMRYEVGLGYLGYREKVTDGFNSGKISGATLGTHLVCGIDYEIASSFSLGFNFALVGGSLSSVNYDNLTTGGVHIDEDNRLGLSRINFNVNLSYCF